MMISIRIVRGRGPRGRTPSTNPMRLPTPVFAAGLTAGLLVATLLPAADFYVAPAGSDANPGTLAQPFASITKAQDAASSGDTVHLRGGTYVLDESDIAADQSGVISVYKAVHNINKNGISYIAYQDEVPVFDFTAVTPSGHRVTAFWVSADDCVFEGFHSVGVQITIAQGQASNTQSEYFRVVNGYRNRFERLVMRDGMGYGWYLQSGGDNLVLNCDAYNNIGLDSLSVGNIDGFGVHTTRTTDTGNVLRGCRAWYNSDDGYDLINCYAPVTVENCWAFYNGYAPGTTFANSGGEGKGFKSGGYGAAGGAYPTPPPRHIIRFNLAVRNRAQGFYANHHPGGLDWINNSAYLNGTNYDMLNTLADNDTDVDGYDHYMRNNLGYDARGSETVRLGDPASNNYSHNYFDLPVTVAADDFVSLDESLLTAPRQPDGSLPDNGFMRLAGGSDLIDAGVNDGFPFSGTAPDLGAFEYAPPTPPAAPANLSAVAGDASVALDWDDNGEADLASYTVYRATASGGSYNTVASGVLSSDYADAGLTNGTTYYYVVTATDDSGNESGYSDEQSATPAAAVVDADGDLLDDGWELTYYASINHAGPLDDTDSDGANSWLENKAGTDPTDNLSFPGQTVTGDLDLEPVADTAVWYRSNDSDYAALNYGTDPDIDNYAYPAVPIIALGYFRFDLSAAPAGATVDSASLTLTKAAVNPPQSPQAGHSTRVDGLSGGRFAVYGLLDVPGNTAQDWSELALHGDSSGDEFDFADAGSDPPVDTATRTVDLDGVGESVDGTTASISDGALATFLQGRLDAAANRGLATFITDIEESANGKGYAFVSREGSAGLRPSLAIDYSVTIPVPDPDEDADGLEDAWEAHFLGTLDNTGDDDGDGDGTPEWLEQAIGTNPGDPGETFSLTIERDGAGLLLRWPNGPGVDFSVLSSTVPGSPWNPEASVGGSASPATLTHPVTPLPGAEFFQVSATEAP